MTSALGHLKVLDLTRILAGPWATQNLADMGAEVIKIERPMVGDDTRGWGPPFLRDAQGRETRDSSYFLSANRGKKSMTCDISTPEGAGLIRDLGGGGYDPSLGHGIAKTAYRNEPDSYSLQGIDPAMQDLVGGQVAVMFNTYDQIAPFLADGKKRAIAVAQSGRSKMLPDLPSLAEQGVTSYDVAGWQALILPAGTSAEFVRKLHDAYARAATDPALKQKLEAAGMAPVVSTPAEAAAYIKNDVSTWAAVVKAANISIAE